MGIMVLGALAMVRGRMRPRRTLDPEICHLGFTGS